MFRAIGLMFLPLMILGSDLYHGENSKLNAAVYSAQLDVERFGYLGESDLPDIGSFASAPIATVNAYVFLQNRFPHVYGNKLAGTSLEDWVETARTLATAPYMDTISNEKTFVRDQLYGHYTYLNEKVPDVNRFAGSAVLPDGQDWTPTRPQPPFVVTEFPTWQSLYLSILQEQAILINVFFDGPLGKTHTVTGTSFHWNDIDGDSFIDFDENAEIDFIDPKDPATPPDPDGKKKPKRRWGRVYEEVLPFGTIGGNRRLRFVYNPPGDDLPGMRFNSSADGFITSAFYTLEPVPEPSSMIVFSLGLVGWQIRSLRRRKALQATPS
jgi:hypothetical protein